MKGFILAAGFGTRLEPLTHELPKALIPVATVPAIQYAIRLLAVAGVEEVFVNLYHLGDQIEAALGNGQHLGIRLRYSREPELLGTGGGLRKIAQQLEGQRLVVINADTLFDVDLRAAIAFHEEKGAIATMVLRRDPRQSRYGLIEIDGAGRIRRFLGDHAPGDKPNGATLKKYMFAGVHILEPRFLEYIPPDIQTCVNRYAYPKAIHNGELLCGFVCDGIWRDLGSLASYFQANLDVLDRRVVLPYLDPLSMFAYTPQKEVDSIVRLGENTTLGSNVLLHPPVLIADGVSISDNAVIGPYAIIGRDAVIGKQSKLKDVIIFNDARVRANTTLARCIISRKHTVSC